MKEMKKDEKIERAFREYFDGNEAPRCDLTQAKRELAAPKREKNFRGTFLRVASLLACVLFVCVCYVGILFGTISRNDSVDNDAPQAEDPSETKYYNLSSAQAEYAPYGQISQQYGEMLNALSPFEWADNARAEYTLYAVEGEAVLIGVQLRYLRGTLYWEGELYIDLTDGNLLPEELKSFDDLSVGGSVAGNAYSYSTRYRNGEYISDAKLSLSSADYYMTVMGQNKNAVFFLLRLLAGTD